MNYYIQGSAARAEQIKAAFEKLGYRSTYVFNAEMTLYFTFNGEIKTAVANSYKSIIKTHPDYKELELTVEPEFTFKVGDWVVYNGASVWQVNEIDRNMPIPRYELTNNDGDKLSVPFTSEYNLKEWTIRDAKDGDVLVTDFFIFLFKKVDNGNGVHYYCHRGAHGEAFDIALSDSLMGRVGNSLINYRPATKEQCDLLFSKIKEAGYHWDADKKELRKIQPHYDISNLHVGMPVLVRADNVCRWNYSVFSHITGNKDWQFAVCNGVSFTQCIPFEGNEHLLGTTDMPDEMYVNW